MEANYYLSEDMKDVLCEAAEKEESPLGCQILNQLKENLDIAGENQIPICQDTGMAVVFASVGQDVRIEGGVLPDAINEGVRQGYTEGYLRKSVVKDPFIRENTKDNTPAVIHTRIVAVELLRFIFYPVTDGTQQGKVPLHGPPGNLGELFPIPNTAILQWQIVHQVHQPPKMILNSGLSRAIRLNGWNQTLPLQ